MGAAEYAPSCECHRGLESICLYAITWFTSCSTSRHDTNETIFRYLSGSADLIRRYSTICSACRMMCYTCQGGSPRPSHINTPRSSIEDRIPRPFALGTSLYHTDGLEPRYSQQKKKHVQLLPYSFHHSLSHPI